MGLVYRGAGNTEETDLRNRTVMNKGRSDKKHMQEEERKGCMKRGENKV